MEFLPEARLDLTSLKCLGNKASLMRGKMQPVLPGFGKLDVKEFGGTLVKGNPREKRPLSLKRPVHVVLKSSIAKGEMSFLKRGRAKQIESLVRRIAKQKGVKVYRYANAGNHLHLLVLPRSRESFNAYIRALSGLIARITLGVERGKAKASDCERTFQLNGVRKKSARGGRVASFWDARPYTRIVEWGRDFRSVCSYVVQNTLEAIGFIPYQPRRQKAGVRAKAKAGNGRWGPAFLP
jgi:REP element-mobilizing transposase RayT